MPRKDPEFERWRRLMHPPLREFHDAFRKGVPATEAVLEAFWQGVLTEGDPFFYYGARYQFVTYYALIIILGRGSRGLRAKLLVAIEEMEKYEPNSPQIPIYAARNANRALGNKRVALRLVNKGLELARKDEKLPAPPGEYNYPFVAMALRVELSIHAGFKTKRKRVTEILEELAEMDNVATLHDYEREETITKLLAVGIHTDALRQLLLKDRKVFAQKRLREELPQRLEEIDGWLALFDGGGADDRRAG